MARNENGKGFSLKDHLFNLDKVAYLAELIQRADPKFDAETFQKKVMSKLAALELKERIVWITEVLEDQLPQDFEAAAAIIVKSLPVPLDPDKTDNDFGDFIFAPLGEYVVRNGLHESHLKTSLHTLQEITMRFSMEDAIRYFLNAFETETFKEMSNWTQHRNYHVRRLVSEGTRPLLPWSGRISLAIEKPIGLMDDLYHDATRYVTRSVANHMNDIAKKNPSLVIKTLKRWKEGGKQDPEEMEWIIAHSLRTLVKDGNKDALELLGYGANPKITVTDLKVSKSTKKISIGESIEFSFTIEAKDDCRLMIDYLIDFQKANGKRGVKVYKLKKAGVVPGQILTVSKKHAFPKDASTLTFYPGPHVVKLQINGQSFGEDSFILT